MKPKSKFTADEYQFHTRMTKDEEAKMYFVTLDFYKKRELVFSVPIAKQLLNDMLIDCARLEDLGLKEFPFYLDHTRRHINLTDHLTRSFR